MISSLFKSTCRRYGLNQKERTPLETAHFRVPPARRSDGQLGLFG
jgi:hypothetical protein